MGGKCLSVGDAEETRAHPRPKRHGGQHGPLVCMQGARARIAHLCQIGSGPLSVLPDVFRPSAVTTYNISPLSYRDSPPLTTLPPYMCQAHIGPCAGEPVGGEKGLTQDRARLETSVGDALGTPASASFRSPGEKGIASVSGEGNQATELLLAGPF